MREENLRAMETLAGLVSFCEAHDCGKCPVAVRINTIALTCPMSHVRRELAVAGTRISGVQR